MDPYNAGEPGRVDQLRTGIDAFWRRLDEIARRAAGFPQWKRDSVRAWERQARGQKEGLMGYYTRVTGHFRIDPPIRGRELHGFDEEDIPFGFLIEIEEERKPVDEGTLITRKIEFVEPYDDTFKAYHFKQDLQDLVDRFPGHKWVGMMEGEGEEQGDMWRLYIRDGKVIEHVVKVVWPDPPEEE